MTSYKLALLSKSAHISYGELTKTASAVETQIIRDFSSHWNVTATMTAFSDEKLIPKDYFKFYIVDTIDVNGALGYHSNDRNGNPYSVILSTPDWSKTVSHEALEMIIDPQGNNLILTILDGKNIHILKEVCDPPENFSYKIDGVVVSDFVFPSYFDSSINKYRSQTFTGVLQLPLNIAYGGYFSYMDSENNWYQRVNFGKLQTVFLGSNSRLIEKFGSIREAKEAVSNY